MSIDVNEAMSMRLLPFLYSVTGAEAVNYLFSKAIRDMLPIIDPEEDYLTIVGAEEKISIAEDKRKKELEEAHANLKALARVLEATRVSSTRPASVPSAEAHATALNELDSSRLSLAKAISDAEGLIASREAELTRLKDEAHNLENYDPAVEHSRELDGTVLRLKLYKGLGFEPIVDKRGNLIKLLVRSRSGDIYPVDIQPNQPDFDLVQNLWRIVAS